MSLATWCARSRATLIPHTPPSGASLNAIPCNASVFVRIRLIKCACTMALFSAQVNVLNGVASAGGRRSASSQGGKFVSALPNVSNMQVSVPTRNGVPSLGNVASWWTHTAVQFASAKLQHVGMEKVASAANRALRSVV